jgi:hypothetical protein
MPEPEKPPRLFLSYTRKDSAAVKELYQKLKQAGYHPWMDIEDILPGQVWEQVMIEAINNAMFFLACLSTNSIDHRGVVQEEIKQALQVWRRKLDDDIYFIPIRLNECKVPDTLAKFNWVDVFQEHGFSRLLAAIRAQMERLGHVRRIALRSQPVNELAGQTAVTMLQEKDFYDGNTNWMGKGIKHQYEVVERNGKKLVIDYTTSLMWQQSGSPKKVNYADAEQYVRDLNNQKFAGYNDWRLPTLEEAMSLMEPKKQEQGLFTDSVFDKTQKWIWTADSNALGVAWLVAFSFGNCNYYDNSIRGLVRAVRSR